MPYTLKTEQVAVKDPLTGEYTGVDVLAEQTEEGLLAELRAEGARQQALIVADVDSAEENALKAEGFAVGEQDGTAVGSTSPYYHNNAEYFRDQAASSAMAASGSATAAATSAAYAQAFTGAPRVAATAAAMTDADLIYVYTGSESGYTAGNWYYYNGSAWASGGVYNSGAVNVDATLAIAGAAADAAACGEIKSAFDNEKKGILSFDLISNSYVAIDGTITPYNNWKRTDYTFIGDCSLLVAKTSASSNYNCFYDSTKNFVSHFTVGTSDTEIVIPDNAEYVIFSNTNAGMDNLFVSFVSKVQGDIDSIENRLVSDKYEIKSVRSAFENNVVPLALSAFTSGKYIDNNGAEQSNLGMSYVSCAITDDDVGKTIYIDGSAWYSIKPFVFVGTSGNIVRSMVSPEGNVPTQYTDLIFSPMESGTLYVNRYASGSNVHIAKAYYNAVGNLSESNFSDAISYTPVQLGNLISGRLVSAVTGEITETESTTQNITNYIEVTGDTYYLITTQMYYGYGMYVWYDEDKNYISGRKSENGSERTKMYCERVKSPSNAAYLIIGYLYETSFTFPFLMKGRMNAAYPSKRWNGLKWTGIGDSLTEAYSVTGAHYFDLICAATGIAFVNKGVSGTGYAKGTSNFMTCALTVAADSDVVTFFGSGNDASSGLELGDADDTGTTTIAGCINTAIDNVYSVNPIMNIGLITPTPWLNNMPYDNGWMERYSNLIVEICKRRSIPCLDLFHCSGLNPNSSAVRETAYSRDGGGGTHPDENGHKLFAPRIQAFLDSLLIH